MHIKDIGLGEYQDGFLLSEVPLGQGILDLAKIVDTIRGLRPDLTFGLEMPGRDLVHVLKLVRTKGTKNPQYIAKLSPADQLKAEDDNNNACIKYARENLGL